MSFANKVNRQLQASSKRQDEIEARVEENGRKTENNSQEIVKLREELSRVRMALESERGERSDMLSEELRDRELRKNNLVIHGLPEPNESSSYNRARIEQDRAECGNLLATMGIRMRQEALRFCRRVGERGQNPRPIIIGLRTEEEKRAILDRARQLRGTKYDNVAIVPDMTKMQRQAEDKLTREVESRNGQLTAEDREKNLKWLVVGKRGEKRLIKGTERESMNSIRREPQLGDFFYLNQASGGGGVGGGGAGAGAGGMRYTPAVPLPAGRGGGPQQGYGNHNNGAGRDNRFGNSNGFTNSRAHNGNSNRYGGNNGYSNNGFSNNNGYGNNGTSNSSNSNGTGYNNNNRGGPSPSYYGQGGGNGNGGGNGGRELGARSRTPLDPPLLSPLNNRNPNYTPIQHRTNRYSGGGNGGGFSSSGGNNSYNPGHQDNNGFGNGGGNFNNGYNNNHGNLGTRGGGNTNGGGNLNGGYNNGYGNL
jgi:hypothetical protein